MFCKKGGRQIQALKTGKKEEIKKGESGRGKDCFLFRYQRTVPIQVTGESRGDGETSKKF